LLNEPRINGDVRRHLTSLLVVLLALRCLVPAGFMLQQVGDGLSIVICTASGPQLLAVDDEGKPAKHDRKAGGHDMCPYAPAGAVAAATDSPLRVSAPAVYVALTYARVEDRRKPQDWSGAYLARGPPVFLA
jgi:hypothetical protein